MLYKSPAKSGCSMRPTMKLIKEDGLVQKKKSTLYRVPSK